ncbi:MAG: metal ABC transporter permease [Chloroflexi bacterium]|nr:metal ABC transporter permease [Chloroflexota bacterium]
MDNLLEPLADGLVGWLVEPFALPFMQRALVGALGVGVLCAVVGTFVVLLGLAFIGEGVSHGSLAGLALGYVLKLDLLLASVPFGIGLALLIGYLAERTRTRFDAAVGVVFATSAALGIALIGAVRVFPDLNSYLFGNVLAIRPLDLLALAIAALLVLVPLLLLSKELTLLAFDPEMARVVGVPTRLLYYLLLGLIGLTVVISLRTLGVILVTALLVIPASAGRQLAGRIPTMMLAAVIVSILSAVAGLLVSFHLSVGSGASIVLCAAVCFALSLALGRIRRPTRPDVETGTLAMVQSQDVRAC